MKFLLSIVFPFSSGAAFAIVLSNNVSSLRPDVESMISIGGDIATIVTCLVAVAALRTWKLQHTHSEKWKKIEILRDTYDEFISKQIAYWYAEEKRLATQHGIAVFPFKKVITDQDEITRICNTDIVIAIRGVDSAQRDYEQAFRRASILFDLPESLRSENICSRFNGLFEDFSSNFLEYEIEQNQRVYKKYYDDELEQIYKDGELFLVKLSRQLK